MSDIGPIITNRPRAMRAYQNKYGSPTSFANTLRSPIQMRLRALDAGRVNIGQSPLTKAETKVAGKAASEHRAVVPEPKGNFFQNIASDVGDIAGAIPKLPALLANEALDLPSVGTRWEELNRDASGNPIESFGNLASLPGLRLVPGSFVASQFGTGGQGVGGLVEHPVFTALDVLPYAQKAASLTPTYKAALGAAEDAATLQHTLPRRVTPIGANLRSFPRAATPFKPSRVTPGVDVPTLERNIFGRTAEVAADRLTPEFLRRPAIEGFSGMERNQARVRARLGAETRATTAENPLPAFEDDLSRAAATVQQGTEPLEFFRESLGPERALEVEEIARIGNPNQLSTLTDAERQYAKLADDADKLIARQAVDEGLLGELEVNGVRDFYPKATEKRILAVRNVRDKAVAVQWLRDTLNPKTISTATPDEILTHFRTAMNDTGIRGETRVSLARGYLAAYEGLGFDVAEARKVLTNPNKAKLVALPDQLPTTPTRATVIPKNRAANRYEALSYLDNTRFTPGRMGKAIRAVENAEAKAIPDRFVHTLRGKFKEKMIGAAEAKFAQDPARLEQALNYLDRPTPAYQEVAAMMGKEYQAIKAEVRTMTQELRDAGYDPQFQHMVHPERVGQYDFAQVTADLPSLKQFKQKIWEPQNFESSFVVSLDHRSMEILLQKARKYYVNEDLVKRQARDQAYLRSTYWDAAEASGKDVDALIKRDWGEFDPNSYIQSGNVAVSPESASTLYLPRATLKNLERMTAVPSDFARGAETALKPFRTSVIALSPRLHLYNTVGGTIMTTGRMHNPANFIRNFPRAIKMVREETLQKMAQDPNLTAAERAQARLLPGGQQNATQYDMGKELATNIKRSSPKAAREKAHNALAGSQIATWIDQGAEAAVKNGWNSGVAKYLRQGFNKVTARSMWLNETVDNFMRAESYMDAYQTAVKKGASGEEALTKGVQAVRDTLQNFDTMTPLERTSMRYLMPFWSWARTALRYAFTYPGDHPWRMSILASLARTETEDFNTGLPQYMKSWLFLGDTKSDGTVTAINLDGMNPFRDVANYFTLGGFLAAGEGNVAGVTSQLNPLLGTALQQLGVDTFQGQAELFPDVTYNPATGQLEAKPKESLPTALVGNLVPQARLLMAVTGRSNQYKELMRRDPAAAGRFLASSVGLPVLGRQVDVPMETMKAELTRYNAYRDTRNRALKSGDIGSLIDKYPALAAFKNRVAALTPQQRARYAPTPGMAGAENPGYGDLARGTIGAVVPGLG